MDNESLKEKYDDMHAQGPSAWFSDGKNERDLILSMGGPWQGKKVLEIGCGEGELCELMIEKGAVVTGVDYSSAAIKTAQANHPGILFRHLGYTQVKERFDRVVMQGVLEHMDCAGVTLEWIIKSLLLPGADIITSSPCFLNPRGLIWMALDLAGAVMSKTDLHFLHPWEFDNFCRKNGYKLEIQDTDISWGGGPEMLADLRQRIPPAFQDGSLHLDNYRYNKFLKYMEHMFAHNSSGMEPFTPGATMAYKITP